MNLTYVKSGVSKEHNFSWVLAALKEYDSDGWLVADELVIAQRQGTKKLTEKDMESVPPSAWRTFKKKEEA